MMGAKNPEKGFLGGVPGHGFTPGFDRNEAGGFGRAGIPSIHRISITIDLPQAFMPDPEKAPLPVYRPYPELARKRRQWRERSERDDQQDKQNSPRDTLINGRRRPIRPGPAIKNLAARASAGIFRAPLMTRISPRGAHATGAAAPSQCC